MWHPIFAVNTYLMIVSFFCLNGVLEECFLWLLLSCADLTPYSVLLHILLRNFWSIWSLYRYFLNLHWIGLTLEILWNAFFYIIYFVRFLRFTFSLQPLVRSQLGCWLSPLSVCCLSIGCLSICLSVQLSVYFSSCCLLSVVLSVCWHPILFLFQKWMLPNNDFDMLILNIIKITNWFLFLWYWNIYIILMWIMLSSLIVKGEQLMSVLKT